jgi:hypothetical protein
VVVKRKDGEEEGRKERREGSKMERRKDGEE